MNQIVDVLHWAGSLVGLDAPALAVPDATWRLSADGRATLLREEGCRLVAYQDVRGIWTIGVGHTAARGEPAPVAGMKISQAQADAILAADVAFYERAVVAAVKVKINQAMFDALVRWCFNIGVRAMTNSTAIERLNGGDAKGCADAILMWNKPEQIRPRRWREHRDFACAAGVPFIEEEKAYV